MRPITRICSLILLVGLSSGCSILLPEVSTMPVVHNPFPQLSRVAVAPFFNLSDEPTVDGRDFALAYYAELQAIPGFEVVPLGVVEEVMLEASIRPNDLASPADARRLGQLLGVDVIVVGAVTDYSPYYPPRCGMRVEWYATNPGFHEIPAGYGLPWGTPDEEYIPQNVVFDAEMALAKAQMDTQSPECPPATPMTMPPVDAYPIMPPMPDLQELVPINEAPPKQVDPFEDQPHTPADDTTEEPLPSPAADAGRRSLDGFDIEDDDPEDPLDGDAATSNDEVAWRAQRQATFKIAVDDPQAPPASDAIATDGAIVPAAENNFAAQLPPDWPDASGFVPCGPSPVRPECVVNNGPVMTHTRIFLGHDPEFTAALAAYVDFRDDARFGGWRSYLERSDDFIRFCCHLHISEMLSARGGATETRVVRHWSNSR